MARDTGWIATCDLVLKVLAGAGAAVAFAVGLHQYNEGQAWQRASVVISLIDSFNADPKIQTACAMLDWDERTIRVDDKHSFEFRNAMLLHALEVTDMDISPRSSGGQYRDAFTRDEMVMRDAFDRFFDFFDKLYALNRAGLLRFSDYYYFNYWLELLRGADTYKSPAIKTALDNYINEYHFIGVQELLLTYGKDPTPLKLPSTSQVRQPCERVRGS